MKHWWQCWQRQLRVRVIARFGQAQLVVTTQGRLELRGGSAADVAEAREWISLFMPEAVPVWVPLPAEGENQGMEARRRFSPPGRRPSASVGAPG